MVQTRLLANILAITLLFGPTGALRAEEMVVGDSPTTYNPAPNSRVVQDLNNQYRAESIKFTQYRSASDNLTHQVKGLSDAIPSPEVSLLNQVTSADSSSTQSPVPVSPSAAQTPDVTFSDPTGYLSQAQQSALLSALSLFPQNQWKGLKNIVIQPSATTLSIFNDFDATSDSLILKVPANGGVYKLDSTVFIMSEALGYYYYLNNLDTQTKAEYKAFYGSGFSDRSIGLDFGVNEGTYIDGALLSNLKNPTYTAGGLANYLFTSALFAVPGQPSAYVYNLSLQGLLTRTTVGKYIFRNEIHVGDLTAYFDNRSKQITKADIPGLGLMSYSPPITVPDIVWRTFKAILQPRRLLPIRR